MQSSPNRQKSFIRMSYDDIGLRAYRHRTSAKEGNARRRAVEIRSRRSADTDHLAHDLGSKAFD